MLLLVETGTKDLMNTLFKQMPLWSGYDAVKFASKSKWSQQIKKTLWTGRKKEIVLVERGSKRHLACTSLNTIDQNCRTM